MADQFAQALLGKAEAPYRGGGRPPAGDERLGGTDDGDEGQSVLKSYDEAVAATEESDADPEAETDAAPGPGPSAADGGAEVDADAATGDAATADAADVDATAADSADEPNPPDDVDPVTRDDVAESALRFDEAIELGTREAVIDELRSRIESLPELSRGMLRHYRREGASDPVAAHIDAGGDGDSGHAYSRHRPIRRAGLIRHAGRGSYAYAVPDLVREAYADRLDEAQVDEIVRAVERVFVPSAELDYPPDAAPAEVGDRAPAGDDEAEENTDTDAADGDEEPSAPTDAGLSDAARRFAERSER
jgi:hypothetical protein